MDEKLDLGGKIFKDMDLILDKVFSDGFMPSEKDYLEEKKATEDNKNE